MRYLSEADTDRLVDWPSAIRCMTEAYRDASPEGAIPGRLIASSATAWIRCLPAIPAAGRFLGTKQIVRSAKGRITYLITLADKETGVLEFIMDAISLTAVRTAATSVAAVTMLPGPEPMDLAILGSGLEAHKHLEALAASRRIGSLRIYSPTAENRERFAAESAAKFGLATSAVRATATPREAVDGATHVLAAARARGEQPILHGDWLADDAIVVSVGSTIPIQREVDVSVIARAALIVADVPEELIHDTGDMLAAAKAGIDFESKMFSLHDLAQGRVPAERLNRGVRLFKSVGSALQDIALAGAVAERALQSGTGADLGFDLQVKQSIGRNA
ncbi:MAG: ornithine cyclodeaminase family protein [Betaproteobacteria bacterium]|nr:ornithine cyclodeaminase family protein [Betaproteobacteria bacterium]